MNKKENAEFRRLLKAYYESNFQNGGDYSLDNMAGINELLAIKEYLEEILK